MKHANTRVHHVLDIDNPRLNGSELMEGAKDASGKECWDGDKRNRVQFRKVPIGAWLLTRTGIFNFFPEYR